MTLFHYMIRTLLIVLPSTALIGLGVCYFNGLQGSKFWLTLVSVVILGGIVGVISAMINHKRFIVPIGKINTYLQGLEKGDLSTRLNEHTLGQLNTLGASLNKTVDEWSHVIVKCKMQPKILQTILFNWMKEQNRPQRRLFIFHQR